MVYEYRDQPMKGFYLAYQFLTTALIRFPIWCILAIPRSLRPRSSWNMKKVVMVRLVRQLGHIDSKVGVLGRMPNYLAIEPGPNVNGVWVEPATHLITGDLKLWASIADVGAIRIPGYWMHKHGSSITIGAPPMPHEKVILSFHGGAYIRFSGHPAQPHSNIARQLLKHLDDVHRVLSIEYRLSEAVPFEEVNPFPAALLDALAGYNYLVNVVGFSPEDIILEGDSAGANLALALTRYLLENFPTTAALSAEPKLLAPPGALILFSPWCDLGATHAPSASDDDYIQSVPFLLRQPVTAFTGPHGLGAAEINRYISPASLHPAIANISFRNFPRTFLIAGGAEVLLPQIHTLRDRMIRDLCAGDSARENDGKFRYYEAKDAVHDYIGFDVFEPERTQTFRELALWVAAA